MPELLADEKEVSIGADHLKLLEAVAEAASDLKRAERDGEFAEMNGGIEILQSALFMKTAAWEVFASSLDERE